jgi:hypothetical protein
MTVLNNAYDVIKANQAALLILSRFLLDPTALPQPFNLLRLLFDPRLARSFVMDWQHIARALLSRAHREVLARPSDSRLAQLLQSLRAYPDVPTSLLQPDFSEPSEPTLTVRLKRNDLDLSFLTTITVFNAPQNVTLEELRIESYFPLDDATAQACATLAGRHEASP